jgi:hypothetical protein
LLKYHGQVGADADHLGVIARVAGQAAAFPRHRFAAEKYITLLAVFQQIGATQQRRFSRS